jgi:hypothetical protein
MTLTVSYRHELSPEENHIAASVELCRKMDDRCRKVYGIPEGQSWGGQWALPKAVGQMADGHYAHVFLPRYSGQVME